MPKRFHGQRLMPDERRLALRLMQSGLATAAEIAALVGVSRAAVHYWSRSKAGGAKQITDYAQARERRLILMWRTALAAGHGAADSAPPPWYDDLTRDDWEAGAPTVKTPSFIDERTGQRWLRIRTPNRNGWEELDQAGNVIGWKQERSMPPQPSAPAAPAPAPPSNSVADARGARLRADAAPADTRTIDEIIAAELARDTKED